MTDYKTIKLPKGLLEKIRQVVEKDTSYLNPSDFIRQAIREMISKINNPRR